MKSKKSLDLRLRIFAGPNGSGKTTVINYIRDLIIDGRKIDFGYYVNADDIANELHKKGQSLTKFGIRSSRKEFLTIATGSGLINESFTLETFKSSFIFSRKNCILVSKAAYIENLAQIIADFIRKKLLSNRKKFSFETVFSHPSKLDIMRQAIESGYKVYLYFVSTESPAINKFRVTSRVAQNGHSVPPDKIESRYYRSMELLFDAAQLVYQAYFFDNSSGRGSHTLFANFKVVRGKKKWHRLPADKIPNWFKQYYSNKVPQNRPPKK